MRATHVRTRALILMVALTAGCTRLAAPPARPAGAGDPLAGLRAREQAQTGLRLSLRIQADTPDGALPSAPAFLAVERPDHLRLQVLSLFGTTVLDLEIAGDRFRLRLPLAGTVRRGRIDAAALALPGTADAERMIVALALLFRAKVSVGVCVARGSREVDCALGDAVLATVRVDGAGRPVEERLVHAGGRVLLVATYEGYERIGPTALPRTIVLRDPVRASTLRVRVVRARIAGP